MSRRCSRRDAVCLAVFSILAAICIAALPAVAAVPASLVKQIQAHLEAGEFAAALILAQQAPTPAERDALRSQIALAQSRAGARDASLSTAAAMERDTSRSQAIKDIASAPIGAGAKGGGAQADFDTLIELITSTVHPQSWDSMGGTGSIQGYEGGVYVDAQGALKPLVQQDRSGGLAELRAMAIRTRAKGDVHRASEQRKVSITRLERQAQLMLAAGRPLPEEIQYLAGLQRIQYLLVYPEQGEIVLVGPADDWRTDGEGRTVGRTSGRPVLRLDDLVVVLRHMMSGKDARFGCSITPSQETLARTKAFLAESSKTPLKPGQRPQWLKQVRDLVGKQAIDVYGIDPRTRVGRILVEADYRMKLVGIGLEPGVPGVRSYLDSIKLAKGEAPPALDVLRWWFTLNYEAVRTTDLRDAFELRGQGVKVLSENELLSELGERLHTGQSEPLNQEFAHSFTKNFAALAQQYPIYAELQNIFDLALVAALMRAEDLPGRVDWHMTGFREQAEFPVELGHAPKFVETVINHRLIDQTLIIAAISGGVRVDPGKLVQKAAIQVDKYGAASEQRAAAKPKADRDVWWWD